MQTQRRNGRAVPQGSQVFWTKRDWAIPISQIAQGNESALRALYDHTSRLIYGLVLRILMDISEAEETTIEVHIQGLA